MRGSTRRSVHSVNRAVERVATPLAYGGVWLLFKVTGVRS